jgi:hypothetical protein
MATWKSEHSYASITVVPPPPTTTAATAATSATSSATSSSTTTSTNISGKKRKGESKQVDTMARVKATFVKGQSRQIETVNVDESPKTKSRSAAQSALFGQGFRFHIVCIVLGFSVLI